MKNLKNNKIKAIELQEDVKVCQVWWVNASRIGENVNDPEKETANSQVDP